MVGLKAGANRGFWYRVEMPDRDAATATALHLDDDAIVRLPKLTTGETGVGFTVMRRGAC